MSKIKLLCTAALVTVLVNQGFTQEEEEYKPIRTLIRTSFGINATASPLQNKNITYNLIGYDKSSYYVQFISGTYFFNSHWGADLALSHNVSTRINGIDANFDQALIREYGPRYYIEPNFGYFDFEEYGEGIGFFKVLTGPAYKVENGKLVIITRMNFGFTSVVTDSRTIQLKEKDTNEILTIQFDSNRAADMSFVISPSVSVGYRIFKRIMVSADIGYTGYKINPIYTQTTTREATGDVTVKTYRYNSFVQEISFGIGTSVILWQK